MKGCAASSPFGSAADIVYLHREKFDGSGCPRGFKGDQIPLGARIGAVACVFDTFLSDRPQDVLTR